MIPLKFTETEALIAGQDWGCNCGPGAIAAVCGLSLADLRPLLHDFENKYYTNPSLMWKVLKTIGVAHQITLNDPNGTRRGGKESLPAYGLARIQWDGPWTWAGVPIRVRYRHSHWIGYSRQGREQGVLFDDEPHVFDINAISVGGWIPYAEWADELVPWLLKQCEPEADGLWHVTHAVEITLEGK